MPMAMTNSATNLELSWKTGPRIFVEKYITRISDVMVNSHLARSRKLVGQTVRLQPHRLMISSVKPSTKILTSLPNDSILSLEKPHYAEWLDFCFRLCSSAQSRVRTVLDVPRSESRLLSSVTPLSPAGSALSSARLVKKLKTTSAMAVAAPTS